MFAHLLPLLEKLSHRRVLCVGDIMVDRYVYGQVDRVSPEAPIPVLRTQRESMTLGGNGNVVRNIVALDGEVEMVGVIGKDRAGQELVEQLSSLPQIINHLIVDASRPTTVKTRYVADNQQLLRADHETNGPVSPEIETQILEHAKTALKNCDIVILSDYAKGVLTPHVIAEIIAAATAAGKHVLVDPKGRDFSRYKGAYMLTPNRKELAEATGHDLRALENVETAGRELIKAYSLGGILAKLSADGVCLLLKDESSLHFRATAREVFDVSGAGDTVVATLALALAGGVSPADSAALANIAGSVVVGKVGTAVVTRAELAHELVHGNTRASEDKIATGEQAASMAERWHQQGLKVGFTNGCFDLLHPGHIHSIRQARAACDRLIIGLNSDSSIKRQKGPNRPVQTENARAIVLASLSDVDCVVIFEQDTPLDIIKAMRPDVLVKGADYTVDTVVGAKEVQSWGGKVVLAQLLDGQSTTATIERMRTP